MTNSQLKAETVPGRTPGEGSGRQPQDERVWPNIRWHLPLAWSRLQGPRAKKALSNAPPITAASGPRCEGVHRLGRWGSQYSSAAGQSQHHIVRTRGWGHCEGYPRQYPHRKGIERCNNAQDFSVCSG